MIQQQGKRKTEYTRLCCFFPPGWNTLRFNQTTVKTTITHNNFRHCCISFSPFVRQPFSKQLYISSEYRTEICEILRILPGEFTRGWDLKEYDFLWLKFALYFKLNHIKLSLSLNGETSQKAAKTALAVCLMLIKFLKKDMHYIRL